MKKICISIQAKTVTELVERIERAAGNADLIELRFDCLDKDELGAEDSGRLNAALGRIKPPWDSITTFRPKEYGGCREISEIERENFWNMGYETEVADLEEDMVENSLYWIWGSRICSFHDFHGSPSDLDSLFDRLASTDADIVKIAVTATTVTDAIDVWKLLERGRSRRKRVIPIAMGEAGKWTRILGLAHGVPITYASLDADSGTAPGQISAADMRDVFRVKELNDQTKVFGLIAGDTSYSLSFYMHNAAFIAAGLNSVFMPLQINDLDSFMRRMVSQATREVELNFGGFSVTNPHKQTVMNYLDEIDPTAKAIGAVNTVKVDRDKLTGFNTDAPGFIRPLENVFGDIRDARVAVVGAGGAARACVYALKEQGADVTVLARDAAKASVLGEEFGVSVDTLGTDHRPLTTDIVVNATPLGTRGERETRTVFTAEALGDVKLVYDLVYNPAETRLLREAKSAGVRTIGGLDMLVAQGAKQFEIWTGTDAPVEVMRDPIEKRLK